MSDHIDKHVLNNIKIVTIPFNLIGIAFIICKFKKVTNPVVNKSFTKTSIWMMYYFQIAMVGCILAVITHLYFKEITSVIGPSADNIIGHTL